MCHLTPITSGTGLSLPSVLTPSETFETLQLDNPDSEQNFELVHENPQSLPSTSIGIGTELIPSPSETVQMTFGDLVVAKPKQQVP